MNKILDEMMVCEVLDAYPQLEEVLAANGLGCAGCPASGNETLREAAESHSIDFEKLAAEIKKHWSKYYGFFYKAG